MSPVKKRNLKPEIIFEDSDIFLINKPAGWVTLNVQTYQGITLQDWVSKNVNINFVHRCGIVHRLDKGTWGIVLAAKNKICFEELQKQFKQRKVKKEYLGLVRGELRSKGELVSPVGRLPYNKLRYGVTLEGKPAQTKFKPVKTYLVDGDIYTLVKVWPKTGRTHQIRVHFKHLGHPLYGDSLYGGKKEEEKPMFLVARKINFLHPKLRKRMTFKIKLPDVLKEVIKNGKKK